MYLFGGDRRHTAQSANRTDLTILTALKSKTLAAPPFPEWAEHVEDLNLMDMRMSYLR